MTVNLIILFYFIDEWKRKKSSGTTKTQEYSFKQGSKTDTPRQSKKFDFDKELIKKRERRDKKIEDREKAEK